MRRWWRLGKVVCMCIDLKYAFAIDHKYAFVLVCMHVCMFVICVYLYVADGYV